EGENAIEELKRMVGHITKVSIGETIRGTYGDYIEENGEIKYFEPAVLIGTSREEVEKELKVWAKYSKRDGGLLQNVISYPPGVKPERTLVLIKPDSFQEVSSKAGNIIDRFSQTGLFIVGARVIHMGINQAEEFYAPIKDRLAEKMKKSLIKEIRAALEEKLDFEIPPGIEEEIAEKLKKLKAQREFNKIIQFMSGRDPEKASPEEREKPGLEKCLALVYEGENAISKIRKVLGETNPEEAAPGTVRKDFGHDVIKNGAHASDSPESAEREMRIIKIEEDDITRWVQKYYPD
ncbi:nucleoside-diphosphate kinase, partial [Candidatus Aerophobetes bacterium]|nr:nucleoside-diphosphate kinase [Candidatus Aerophobetes bacterium]